MPAPQSYYSLKSYLVVGDMVESGVSLLSSTGFTVQEVHYDCSRKRNSRGFPYGPTQSACLYVTLKVASNESSKVFFDHMAENQPYAYSFLYDVSFSKMRQMSDFEDAMVAHGYVVDVEETYESSPNTNGAADQMLLRVKLLLTNITYIGRDSNVTMQITID